mgnify:CR=1 FL=1
MIPGRQFILFAEGTRNDHFDAGFDLNFSWQFYGALKAVYDGQSASSIFTVHHNEYDNLSGGKHWIRFTTNHDESAWDATPVVLFNGIDGALAASVVTIFTGGVPLIYAGQEVGTADNVPFFSNSNTDWDGNPNMKMAYQDILQFYSDSEVAKKGINGVFPHNDVACFKKMLNNEEILIIANLRNNPLEFDVPIGLQNSTWTNIRNHENITLGDEMTLDPYAYLILD